MHVTLWSWLCVRMLQSGFSDTEKCNGTLPTTSCPLSPFTLLVSHADSSWTIKTLIQQHTTLFSTSSVLTSFLTWLRFHGPAVEPPPSKHPELICLSRSSFYLPCKTPVKNHTALLTDLTLNLWPHISNVLPIIQAFLIQMPIEFDFPFSEVIMSYSFSNLPTSSPPPQSCWLHITLRKWK